MTALTKNKVGFLRFIAFFLPILIVFSCTVLCLASSSPKTLVKVGYVEIQGFLYQKDNGGYGGVAYDMLQEIAVYNGWEYEFVEIYYTDCKQLLESGEIDIFVPYQWDEERDALYEYSSKAFCTNKASLWTRWDSPFCYNDFEHMKDIRIGALDGTRNDERFEDFLTKNGCLYTMKNDYPTQSNLIEALNAGEIDAFISASNRGITGCKIISILPETTSYAIANKGDRTLLDKIDSAIATLEVSRPNFRSSLNEKYQVTVGGTYPALTREETEYIKQKEYVTVLLCEEECDSSGNFIGSAKTVFDELSAITGLTFIPVTADNATQVLEKFTNGDYDLTYSFNHDYDWANAHNAWLTQSYAGFHNMVVTYARNTNDIKKVAVMPGTYIAYYVENELGYSTIYCDSYQDCIDKVKAGKADAAYCNSLIGNYYSTFSKYNSLNFLTAYDFYSYYCMAISTDSDPVLVSILDKALTCIPEETLITAFDANVNLQDASFLDMFYAHPVLFIVIIAVIALILITISLLLFHNQSIRKKNQQLAVANCAKTDFLARMSHDMRTPMHGILGLTQLSKNETDEKVIQDNLQQIELSGKYLLALINDTLDMSKIEAGKLILRPQPVNGEDILKNILSNVHYMATQKGVALEIHTPDIPHSQWVPVMADASRLEQVLINIISNAIKFTPSGGTVTLTMETVSIGNGVVSDRYIVRDTGIGISPDFLPHLFEPFSQEKSNHESRDEGTGLGMAIVKQLVELMDGDIRVESVMGKGTTVTLSMQFPICEDTDFNIRQHMDDWSILTGKHVLICEDHPLNAKIIVNLLKRQEITSELAENGKIALELFEKAPAGHFDLILMDIRMPVMDGLEATQAIRSLDKPDAKSIPIIAITANAFDSDVQSCLDAGMNAHLAKPVDTRLLYQTIANWIFKSTAQQGEK